jgi:predicted metal-dependent peptidase
MNDKGTPRDLVNKAMYMTSKISVFMSMISRRIRFVEVCDVNEIKRCNLSNFAIDKYGNLYYNPEWVYNADIKEVTGYIIHCLIHFCCFSTVLLFCLINCIAKHSCSGCM